MSKNDISHYYKHLTISKVRYATGDKAKEARFAPYWILYRDAAAGKAEVKFSASGLAEIRWMLEEYRVSLFAQELHTPEPISDKRIDAKLAEAVVE